jgi:hypothetical protein
MPSSRLVVALPIHLDIVFFALTLLGVGFVAGYATREIISHKRRTEYLTHKLYLPRMMKVEVETAEGMDDRTRDSGGPFLHPLGASASPAVSVADQERLHELLRRMQRKSRKRGCQDRLVAD